MDNFNKEHVDQLVGEIKEQSDVFRPKHYSQYVIEPITFIMINNVPFAEANVIKYVMRWRNKDGIKDLEKAKRYIDMIIENEKREKVRICL